MSTLASAQSPMVIHCSVNVMLCLSPFNEGTQCKASRKGDEHGREHKSVASKDGECDTCSCKSEDSRIVLRIVQPLLDKDDDEERRHRELNAVCVNGQLRADQSADGCASDPVELVQQGHKEHEPACVDTLRNLRRVVDGEGLVTHTVDEVGLFPACAAIFFKHGYAIEDVPPLHHQREQEGLQRGKRTQQECRRDEFE